MDTIELLEKSPFYIKEEDDEDILYPESDGKTMGETDVHRSLMINFIEGLRDFYRNAPDVYVSGNLFIYFSKGDTSACVAPDCFIVKGVHKGDRRTYKVWEEGKTPDLVIEITSKTTHHEDIKTKRLIYQDELKVKEYFLFDPLWEYLKPPLQGFKAGRTGFEPILLKDGRLYSSVLALELGIDKEGWLRAYDPITCKAIMTPIEQAEARRKAEEEARLAREQVIEARKQASEAMAMAAQEKAHRERLEKELQHLKTLLEAQKGRSSK